MTFAKGQSGNPGGRPPGIPDRRTLIAKSFEDEGAAVAKVVVEAAKKGDMQACQIVLTRLLPPLRPKAEKTPFALDTTKPLAAQAAAVVQAVADGHLSAEDAQTVLTCLGTYAALVQADEVQSRLAALERATNTARSAAPGAVYTMEMQ